ncbi:MAG: SCO family protein [Anaerolineales bacterium]
MKTRGAVILAIFLAITTLLVAAYFTAPRAYSFRGSSYEPFPPAPNFALTDQFGHRFELADHWGKVILVFFGYTNCPDICPTTLADYGRIRAGLGEQASVVTFVFITEDPERDTVERLNLYLSAFDPAITGLAGTLEELQPVWDAYHVARVIEPFEGSDGTHNHSDGYTVAHTSRIFVIDRLGRIRLTFPYEMSVADMVADVSHLIEERDRY